MNKLKNTSLSDSDRRLLYLIEKDYFFGEFFFGGEPTILIDLNIQPTFSISGNLELSRKRSKIFVESFLNSKEILN